MLKYIPSRAGIGEASVEAVADSMIEAAAEVVLERAKNLALEAGDQVYADALRVDTGTRPKGRGYRRVIADDPQAAAKEWGDSHTARLRILGQAANVQIFPDVKP